MKVLLASPRGFCAGVDRAIDVVLIALERVGAPIYVRKQIVHNRHVIEALSARGAVFVDEVADAPPGSTLVVSAHGAAPAVYRDARKRGLKLIDATCPLVTKVHREALGFVREGRPIVIVGDRAHDEIIGTLGYGGTNSYVVRNVEDAKRLEIRVPPHPGVITQTTLAVGDARDIIEALRKRFPGLVMSAREDICYATQNRQSAISEIARQVEVVLVIGSPTSSNSNRLREVALGAGVPSYLIEDVSQIRTEWLDGASSIGLSSGASTPDRLVSEVLDFIRERYGSEIEIVEVVREDTIFTRPAAMAQLDPAASASAPPLPGARFGTTRSVEVQDSINAGR